MRKVLFAWIGGIDLDAAKTGGANGLGPVCQTITDRQFDEIVLLSNYEESNTTTYLKWLGTKKVKNLRYINVDLGGNPTDYRSIYENAKLHVHEYLNASLTKVQLIFLITGGTPAMQTVWIILANSHFNAKLIKSSIQRGVEDVDLPFDIAADYLPELLKKNGQKISALFTDIQKVNAGFETIIHQSSIMKHLIHRASIISPYPVTVLILGESGTGKELLASSIHTASLRKGKFVPINCGAIPSELFESEMFGRKRGGFTGATIDSIGYIEEARGGTLFLDEIGEMPLCIQVKLLRVLQEGKFNRVGDPIMRDADIRVIAATNRNLAYEAANGKFRVDLYHRLTEAILNMPPLRERAGDIGLLATYLLNTANKKLAANNSYKTKTLSASARSMLIKHFWPGNVRELQNTILRAALWSQLDVLDKQAIEDAMLPTALENNIDCNILNRQFKDGFDLEEVIAEVACHYLERAMKVTGGNKSKAAKILNFNSYQCLDGWLKKYHVS